MIDVRYSVYSAKDGLPLIINGTIPQCARALGMTLNSFQTQASRQRHGKKKGGSRKYCIVREESEALNERC